MKHFFTLFAAAIAAGSYAQTCCAGKKVSAEETFMQIAREMEMKAEGKAACCRSTPEKPVAKGEKGCCNAPSEPKPFKVFVAGEGYKFFGCEDSAGKGRQELVASGKRVGPVQKVTKPAKA